TIDDTKRNPDDDPIEGENLAKVLIDVLDFDSKHGTILAVADPSWGGANRQYMASSTYGR
ncbi:MAG: hypothetical protein HKO76_02625, partial [Acidimicrobiia bacterium]|nr:hypothetical protein [Acidimicrobiia bacterium]